MEGFLYVLFVVAIALAGLSFGFALLAGHGSSKIDIDVCAGHGNVTRVVNDDSADPRTGGTITCSDGTRYRFFELVEAR